MPKRIILFNSRILHFFICLTLLLAITIQNCYASETKTVTPTEEAWNYYRAWQWTAGPVIHVGEAWYLIKMNDQPVGFVKQEVKSIPDGYITTVQSGVQLKIMGTSRNSSSKEVYIVNNDLTLRKFHADMTIDGNKMKISGEKVPNGINMVVEIATGRKEKLLKTKEPVYPPTVVNVLPLKFGPSDEKKHKVKMLDTENKKIKTVTINMIGIEKENGRALLHFQNDIYPIVDNDIWVDMFSGKTIRESVRDGLVTTELTDAAKVKEFLLISALFKRDLALDFSLIKVDPVIVDPQNIVELTLELDNVPKNVDFPSDKEQSVTRNGDKVTFSVSRTGTQTGEEKLSKDELSRYLKVEDSKPVNSQMTKQKALEIAGNEGSDLQIQKLVSWISSNVTDSFARIDIFVTSARSLNIPTRVVTGIVYVPDKGFLYHSWAEVFIGGWIAVDPTFGQIPADATHIKLAEGDSIDDMANILSIIGRVKGSVKEVAYIKPCRKTRCAPLNNTDGQ
ncbi:MAG: transglutaminase-like domain-containing protein [Desulfuromonadales bacterium]|nr:transglutaminase-like domain-containing protein [Desulfuromonadales bacterium]